MKWQRLMVVLAGAALGFAAVGAAALALPSHHRRHHHRECLPYFLIPAEKVCAFRVFYTNPDGSTVLLGYTSDLLPMPKPPPKRR